MELRSVKGVISRWFNWTWQGSKCPCLAPPCIRPSRNVMYELVCVRINIPEPNSPGGPQNTLRPTVPGIAHQGIARPAGIDAGRVGRPVWDVSDLHEPHRIRPGQSHPDHAAYPVHRVGGANSAVVCAGHDKTGQGAFEATDLQGTGWQLSDRPDAPGLDFVTL